MISYFLFDNYLQYIIFEKFIVIEADMFDFIK